MERKDLIAQMGPMSFSQIFPKMKALGESKEVPNGRGTNLASLK